MELEFRDSFLKDVQRIGGKTVKKKIAAVIASERSAKSLSDISHKIRVSRILFQPK